METTTDPGHPGHHLSKLAGAEPLVGERQCTGIRAEPLASLLPCSLLGDVPAPEHLDRLAETACALGGEELLAWLNPGLHRSGHTTLFDTWLANRHAKRFHRPRQVAWEER